MTDPTLDDAPARQPRRVRLGGNLVRPVVPPGAVGITRQLGPWGNPHRVGKPCRACGGAVHDLERALALHREHLRAHPELVEAARRELAGKDLACWCAPGQPCHGDTLLEVAGGGDT